LAFGRTTNIDLNLARRCAILNKPRDPNRKQTGMKISAPALVLGLALGLLTSAVLAADTPPPSPNGIAFPADYKNWRTLGVSHRTDNNSLRAILGNDIAIAAARRGEINPWPDGAILAKLVFKDRDDDNWPPATVPGRFVHAEFMVKDAEKYRSTGGWGFARWLGPAQIPYGEDADFDAECAACHAPVAHRDFVFTTPIQLP
jgi:hypothetical protein